MYDLIKFILLLKKMIKFFSEYKPIILYISFVARDEQDELNNSKIEKRKSVTAGFSFS